MKKTFFFSLFFLLTKFAYCQDNQDYSFKWNGHDEIVTLVFSLLCIAVFIILNLVISKFNINKPNKIVNFIDLLITIGVYFGGAGVVLYLLQVLISFFKKPIIFIHKILASCFDFVNFIIHNIFNPLVLISLVVIAFLILTGINFWMSRKNK